MTHEITLQELLEHQRGMRRDILEQIEIVRDDQVRTNVKIEKARLQLTHQIDALDKRLDTIEISIVEQKHEPRIRRLEQHAGLSA